MQLAFNTDSTNNKLYDYSNISKYVKIRHIGDSVILPIVFSDREYELIYSRFSHEKTSVYSSEHVASMIKDTILENIEGNERIKSDFTLKIQLEKNNFNRINRILSVYENENNQFMKIDKIINKLIEKEYNRLVNEESNEKLL